MAIKKTTIVKTATAKKSTETQKKAVANKIANPIMPPEERQKMIEREAYFIAEKKGFQGDPQAHWAEAEKKINAFLAKKKSAI
jgi:hypothetical protein